VSRVGTCFAIGADAFGVVFAYLPVIFVVLITVTYLFIVTSCLALPPLMTFSTALVLPLALFNSPTVLQLVCSSPTFHAIIWHFLQLILLTFLSTAISPFISTSFTVT
jgi:hypothetical protein